MTFFDKLTCSTYSNIAEQREYTPSLEESYTTDIELAISCQICHFRRRDSISLDSYSEYQIHAQMVVKDLRQGQGESTSIDGHDDDQ